MEKADCSLLDYIDKHKKLNYEKLENSKLRKLVQSIT